MPTGVHYDGDFSIAQPNGGPIDEIPFPADPKPYLYKQRYWQNRSDFSTLALDIPGPFGGFHVGESRFNDEGGGVTSFDREFATLPATRNEYESFVYPFPIWAIGSGGGIQEFPFSVNSRIQFDYFQTTNPELFIDLPRAPRIIDVFNVLVPLNGFNLYGGQGGPPSSWGLSVSAVGTGYVVNNVLSGSASGASFTAKVTAVGTAGQILSFQTLTATGPDTPVTVSATGGSGSGASFIVFPLGGGEVLAEDTSLRKWKGNFYERKQRFVKIPSTYSFLFGG